MTGQPTKRGPGRPRSKEAEQAILDAAYELFRSRGFRGVSTRDIAAAAHVGRQTIYPWWDNKNQLMVAALLSRAVPETEFPEGLSAKATLERQMGLLIEAFSGETGRLIRDIIAEGQSDPELLVTYRDQFLSIRRQQTKEILHRGIEEGEFDPDLELDVAIDLLYAPIYFRLLVQHQPLDQGLATELPSLGLRSLMKRVPDSE